MNLIPGGFNRGGAWCWRCGLVKGRGLTWWPASHVWLCFCVAPHGLALWAEGCTLPCGRGLGVQPEPQGAWVWALTLLGEHWALSPHLLLVPVRLDWSIMGCTMRLRALMNLEGGWGGYGHGGGCRGEAEVSTETERAGRRGLEREEKAQVSPRSAGSFSTADSARPPAPATGAPHQLLTCRMVSPVSCASCFFCSSEGYGCCGHQQESPCLRGHQLVPEAGWRAQAGVGAGRASERRSSPFAPRGPARQAEPSFGKLGPWAPRLLQQLEANWPALIREDGAGDRAPWPGREATPSPGL